MCADVLAGAGFDATVTWRKSDHSSSAVPSKLVGESEFYKKAPQSSSYVPSSCEYDLGHIPLQLRFTLDSKAIC